MRFLVVVLAFGLITSAGCSGCDGGSGDNADAGPPDAGPGEMICENLAPIASGTCEVKSLGATKLIKGNILTPETVFRGGQVAVSADGQITCVGCDCAQGGETTIVCPSGTVSPGLINTHEHITFQQAEPYTDTGERYEHRHHWRKGSGGHTKIPATGGASGVRISFAELRYVMGGATSIVGSGGQVGLLRNLDNTTNQEGLNHTAVNFETFPLGDSSGTMRTSDCNYGATVTPESLANVKAFEPHTSEGIDVAANNEFRCQSSDTYDTMAPGLSENLLLPKTAMIHAIGLTPNDYGAMATAGTALIWSPRSNITLYGDTARVTTAARMGVEIALGTDWMPTGSMNMLRELRCADELNATYFDGYFSDKQLWEMATLNAAAVTATDDAIGMLAPGHVADIAIFAGNNKNVFRSIIEAEPQDVVLVMRGGKALYGDAVSVEQLASDCDTLDVCGASKRVCLKTEIGKTWSELQTAVGALYPAFACGTPAKEPSCTPKRPQSVSGSTVFTGVPSTDDTDGDGLINGGDNCPTVFNPVRPMDNSKQGDADGDGQGDVCDVCPLDANSTTCSSANPDDRDSDGKLNTDDNCPDVANPAQTDADMDGKGDACDPCPSDANPGTAGCPASIYKIKMGMVATGTTVRVQDAIVTGRGSNGFFVQVKEGSAGYMGPAYSGLFVFTGPMSTWLANAIPGTRVTIDGNVALFQGQLELDAISAVLPETMMAEAAPAAIGATYAEIKTGGSRATELESVLVQVGAASVAAVNPTFGEFTLTAGADQVIVDDFLYLSPSSAVGTNYNQVVGILALRQMASKLEPRSATDLVQGAPTLFAFGPALSYVRAGATGVTTFPIGSELTVTLSSPAQGNTDVAITANSGGLAVAGGMVTVPNGQTTAQVVLDGISQTTDVTLTAQLGTGTPLTAHVRVLGANEQPTSVSLSPASAAVAPNGSVMLTATLDIPAPPGGSTVALSLNPPSAGTLPAMATVAANALFVTFAYTDTTGMNATVIATAGAGSDMAMITVSAGASHLVINEVDYDQIGSDNAEYIEIYNPTPAAISLNNVAVVLINGSTSEAYPTATSTIDLSPAGSIPAFGYLVIAGANIAVSTPALKLDPGWTSDEIQNGSPDGVALVDTSTNTLIDALSYEGSVTMAEVPGIANPVSLVEGTVLSTAVVDTNTAVGALCRSPNGKDTDSANADWKLCTTLSPGTANP
jgi:imidazolonepropionase-like amidohydrolase